MPYHLRRMLRHLATMLLFPIAALAQNRMPPTDIDLKASYCLGITESRITNWQDYVKTEQTEELKALMQKASASAENDLNRLKSYIFPKIGYLDATGLIAAKERAYADFRDVLRQRGVCRERCPTAGLSHKDMDKWNRCIDTCNAEEPAVARAKTCDRVDFLPF